MSDTTDALRVATECATGHPLSEDAIAAATLLRTQAAEITRLRAALAQAGAPEGWQLVPVEPTIGMCVAGDAARWSVDDPTRSAPIYRAMLVAAPTAQAGAGREPVAVCWALEACVDGVWSLQWPPRMTRGAAENDIKAYDPRNVLRIRPMYFEAAPTAHPSTAQREPSPWHALYRRAINEANGLTNYVEDRPELRSAERRISAIEAEARTLATSGTKGAA